MGIISLCCMLLMAQCPPVMHWGPPANTQAKSFACYGQLQQGCSGQHRAAPGLPQETLSMPVLT